MRVRVTATIMMMITNVMVVMVMVVVPSREETCIVIIGTLHEGALLLMVIGTL